MEPFLLNRAVVYFDQGSATAYSNIGKKNGFFNVFVHEKCKKEKKHEKSDKKRVLGACTQPLVKGFIPRKNTYSLGKTRFQTKIGVKHCNFVSLSG